MAMCVMAVVAVAPCQCFSPGGNQITSPGRISSNRTAPALDPAATYGRDEVLAQGVGVPCGPRAGLERDTGAEHPGGRGCMKQGVNTDRAGEILGRPFARGL